MARHVLFGLANSPLGLPGCSLSFSLPNLLRADDQAQPCRLYLPRTRWGTCLGSTVVTPLRFVTRDAQGLIGQLALTAIRGLLDLALHGRH